MKYDITLKYTAEFLREIPPKDLEKLLDSAQQKFFELRGQCSAMGRADKPNLFKKIEKDIARMKTIRRECG